MGALVGGLIGGVGSLFGNNQATGQALTGYNYLASNPLTQSTQGNATNASNASAQLLGTAPLTGQAQTGFNNYLNSTGYQFQQQQGDQALTGSAAARGLLGSGSTAKALTNYGQAQAGLSFNNYLNQLNTGVNQGLTSTGQVGSAGTQGGTVAANNTSSATSGVAGSIGGLVSSGLGTNGSNGNFNNFFGSL